MFLIFFKVCPKSLNLICCLGKGISLKKLLIKSHDELYTHIYDINLHINCVLYSFYPFAFVGMAILSFFSS